ncbi:MAG: hypothetical protein DMF86_24740 [Acidobacteria bacterium]|nr:MAG: hypothetical protein DMF86_24740 [Acidobacteriota bacterium]
MFFKGSRYRTLPQSAHLDARGESLLGVDVRVIPPTDGQFLHTVSDRERLDLLAFKYYADPRRWWLIADANRAAVEFPLDLVDARPVVEEELAVAHAELTGRTLRLVAALGELGTAELGQLAPDGSRVVDLMATVVIVQYTAATVRAAILERIRTAGYRLLFTFAWPQNGRTAEAFTFADDSVKAAWNALVGRLADMRGIRRAESVSAAESLRVVYNTAEIARGTIVAQIEQAGFLVVPRLSRQAERVGAKIVIPPNQAV